MSSGIRPACDRIASVTSYSYTNNCRYIGGYQRIDIKVVQDWLAGYIHPTA